MSRVENIKHGEGAMQQTAGKRRRRGGRPKTEKPSVIDVHVGSRVRLRRTLLSMSQEKLGEAIGLTFQQVQKYERGANRIGASRLYDLSQILDVPVSFFFDGMPEEAGPGYGAGMATVSEVGPDGGEPEPALKRETMELVQAYYKVEDPGVRRRLFELAKAVAAVSPPDIRAEMAAPAL